MMVSYIFNVCFKHAKKARFIIVISNNGFKSTNGTQFIESICYFVNMLSIEALNDDDRRKIYDSVALLITAVPMRGEYGNMKEHYCQVLNKNIKRLMQLKDTYAKLKNIYSYVEELLNYIS